MRKFTKQHRLNLSESLKQTFLNGRTIPNKNFVEVDCLNCKKQFESPYWKIRQSKGKFCSKKCYLIYNYKKIKKCICKNCRKDFSIKLNDFNRGRGKFCSQDCAQKFMKKENHPNFKERKQKICPICKTEFLLPPGRFKKRITCSKTCYKIHLSDKMSGDKSNLWKGGLSFFPYPPKFNNSLKNRIRMRDKVCRLCGIKTEYRLCVHHINYDKNNLHSSNLISLCKICHIKTNNHREFWKGYFYERRNKAEDKSLEIPKVYAEYLYDEAVGSLDFGLSGCPAH